MAKRSSGRSKQNMKETDNNNDAGRSAVSAVGTTKIKSGSGGGTNAVSASTQSRGVSAGGGGGVTNAAWASTRTIRGGGGGMNAASASTQNRRGGTNAASTSTRSRRGIRGGGFAGGGGTNLASTGTQSGANAREEEGDDDDGKKTAVDTMEKEEDGDDDVEEQQPGIEYRNGQMMFTHTIQVHDYLTKNNYTFEQWQTIMADSSIQDIDCVWLEGGKKQSSERLNKSLLTPKTTHRKRTTTSRSPRSTIPVTPATATATATATAAATATVGATTTGPSSTRTATATRRGKSSSARAVTQNTSAAPIRFNSRFSLSSPIPGLRSKNHDNNNDNGRMASVPASAQSIRRGTTTTTTNMALGTVSARRRGSANTTRESNPRRSKRLRSQENDDDTNNNDADTMTTDDNDDDSDGNSDVPTPTVVEFVKRRMFAKRRIRTDNIDDDDDNDSVAIDTHAHADAHADTDSYDNDDDNDDDDNDDIIIAEEFCPGLRVGIFWPLDDAYYLCTVVKKQNSRWLVRYDDGVVERIDPVNEQLCSVRYKKRLDKFLTRRMQSIGERQSREDVDDDDDNNDENDTATDGDDMDHDDSDYEDNNTATAAGIVDNDDSNTDADNDTAAAAAGIVPDADFEIKFVTLGIETDEDDSNNNINTNTPFKASTTPVYIEWLALKHRTNAKYGECMYEKGYPGDDKRMRTAIIEEHKRNNPEAIIEDEVDEEEEFVDVYDTDEYKAWKVELDNHVEEKLLQFDPQTTPTGEKWVDVSVGDVIEYHGFPYEKGKPNDHLRIMQSITTQKKADLKRKFQKKNPDPRLEIVPEANTSGWSIDEKKLYKKCRKLRFKRKSTANKSGSTSILGRMYRDNTIGEFYRQLFSKIEYKKKRTKRNKKKSITIPKYKDTGKVLARNTRGYYRFNMLVPKRVEFPNGEILTESTAYYGNIPLHPVLVFKDICEREKNCQPLTEVERDWKYRIINDMDVKGIYDVSHLDHNKKNIDICNIIVEKSRSNGDRCFHCFVYGVCTECDLVSINRRCKCDPPCELVIEMTCFDCITNDDCIPLSTKTWLERHNNDDDNSDDDDDDDDTSDDNNDDDDGDVDSDGD